MSDVATTTAVAPAKSDDTERQALQTEINNHAAEIHKLDPEHRLGKSVKSPKTIEQGKKHLDACKSTLKALQESAKANTGGEPPNQTSAEPGSPGPDQESDMRSKSKKSAKHSARGKAVAGKTRAAPKKAKTSERRGDAPRDGTKQSKALAHLTSHRETTLAAVCKAAGTTPTGWPPMLRGIRERGHKVESKDGKLLYRGRGG